MGVFLPTRWTQQDPFFFGGNKVIEPGFNACPTGWEFVGKSFGLARDEPLTKGSGLTVAYGSALLADGSPFVIEGNYDATAGGDVRRGRGADPVTHRGRR